MQLFFFWMNLIFSSNTRLFINRKFFKEKLPKFLLKLSSNKEHVSECLYIDFLRFLVLGSLVLYMLEWYSSFFGSFYFAFACLQIIYFPFTFIFSSSLLNYFVLCVSGRIGLVFFFQLQNIKKVYIWQNGPLI